MSAPMNAAARTFHFGLSEMHSAEDGLASFSDGLNIPR
jgi:hypothetical protein